MKDYILTLEAFVGFNKAETYKADRYDMDGNAVSAALSKTGMIDMFDRLFTSDPCFKRVVNVRNVGLSTITNIQFIPDMNKVFDAEAEFVFTPTEKGYEIECRGLEVQGQKLPFDSIRSSDYEVGRNFLSYHAPKWQGMMRSGYALIDGEEEYGLG